MNKIIYYYLCYFTISIVFANPVGIGQSYLNTGDLISIRSKVNNKFICVNNKGELIASSDYISFESDSCEIFKIIDNNDNTVSFNSITNYKYISINKNNSLLIVDSDEIENDSQKFEMLLVNKDGSYALRNKLNLKYVCAENNADEALVADRNFANEWENFFIEKIIVEYDYESDAQNELNIDASLISENEFYKAVTSSGYKRPSLEQYNNIISQAESNGNITNKMQLAMFLATVLWESDGLTALREYQCYPKLNANCSYSTGLGYKGRNYYGRGYIQLTWDYNYKAASLDLFNDDRLLKNPDIVATNDSISWLTTFWYWRTRVANSKGVNKGRFGSVTNAVNGVLECNNGKFKKKARKRFEIYKKVLIAFNVKEKADETGCYN